jgi:hypothetical protein
LQRFLRLLADLLRQAQDFDLLREDAQQFVEALLDVEGLEQILLLGGRKSEALATKSASAAGD